MTGSTAWFFPDEPNARARSVDVGQDPVAIASSRSGDFLAIASMGKMEAQYRQKVFIGWRPAKGSFSDVTVVRRADMSVAARHRVPFRPIFVSFGADDTKLTVASLGQWDQNAKNAIASEVVLLDVSSGAVANMASASFWSNLRWHVPSQQRLFMPVQSVSGKRTVNELLIVNTNTGESRRLELPARAVTWSGNDEDVLRHLILNNAAVAVSAAGEIVGRPIAAGDQTVWIASAEDSKRLYLAGKTKKGGVLSLVAEATPVKTFETMTPYAFTIDRPHRRLYLISEHWAVVLDADTFEEVNRLVVPVKAVEATLDPTGRFLYLSSAGGEIGVVDTEAKRKVATFGTGRPGVKFGRALAAAAADALESMNSTSPRYRTSRYPREVKTFAFGPNGRFAFVYNSLGSDINVVDTSTFAVGLQEATGPIERRPFMWQSPDGLHLIVNGHRRLLVFETDTGKLVERREIDSGRIRYLPSLNRVLTLTPSGTTVWTPVPYQKVAELPAADDAFAIDEITRLVLVGKSAVRLYDFELAPRGLAEGAFDPERIAPGNLHVVDVALTR